MTVWSPASVAGFARAAGFGGDDLTTAVAVALAGTGGSDAASWSTATPPQRETRGLWLIPLGLLLSDPDGALYAPQSNAAAAYALTVTAGAGWTWSTVWRSGAWRRFLDTAADASRHPVSRQAPALTLLSGNVGDGGRTVRRILDSFIGKVASRGF